MLEHIAQLLREYGEACVRLAQLEETHEEGTSVAELNRSTDEVNRLHRRILEEVAEMKDWS